MPDSSGIPLLIDLASMRDAMADQGLDPRRVNPRIQTDLVIDHSVRVDFAGSPEAFGKNLALEMERNRERYSLVRWATHQYDNLRVIPPGNGILHQLNLEYLAPIVAVKDGMVFPDTLVGHEAPLIRPTVSEQLDYEGEIVLVIGKAGRHVPKDRALDIVAGVTLANEGSVRDWLRHSKFNVTPGKNFDRSGSLGPWMMTTGDIDLAAPLHLTTRVNGETRQKANTSDLIIGIADLIVFASAYYTLMPGDLLMTGTPEGVGPIAAGDVIGARIDQLGEMKVKVR